MPVKHWSRDEIKFLKENYDKMTYKEIGQIFDRTVEAVSRKAGSLVLSKKIDKLWSKNEVEYLTENYGKISAIKISEYLNRSFYSVTGKAKCLGLKSKYRPITYNEKFFDDWSSDLAWLVGIVLSDGSVSNIVNGKYIRIKMCDKDVLDKIKIITDYEGKVQPCKREKPHYKKPYIIIIGGKKIWQFFTDLGMDNHKSQTAKWPIGLPDEYVSHFIRGVFDGDGSVYFRKNGYPFAGICGTKKLMSYISKSIDLHFTEHTNKTKTNYTIQYTGDRAKDFLKFIYKNSTENIRMDRKYNKVLEYSNGTVFN